MYRNIFLYFITAFASINLYAQTGTAEKLTLQQCIDIAIDNSIQVRQGQVQLQAATVGYNQSKTNLLPNANINVNQGVNQGRSIDPFTNSFVNQKVSYSRYGANSGLTLFNGGSLRSSIQQNRYATDAAKMDIQQLKDNVTLDVILAYLQVLNAEEMVALSKAQVAVSKKQVERLEVLNREGAITPILLYDLVGQMKSDELAVVDNINALELAKLTLSQLMNRPYNPAMQLDAKSIEMQMLPDNANTEEVYNTALNQLAVVKAAALRTRSAATAVKVARGSMYPSLVLGGNINTNFSSAALQETFINVTENPGTDYVILSGNKVPVITKQNNFSYLPITYYSQLKNNVFTNINLGLSIPIFNFSQTRNRIKLARLEVKNVELQEENTKLQLRQQVEQANLNKNNAWQRYQVLLKQVEAYATSFRATEVRFNAGVGNSVDYMLAKNNLDRANANLIMARYDYLLRSKVLLFYSGRKQ